MYKKYFLRYGILLLPGIMMATESQPEEVFWYNINFGISSFRDMYDYPRRKKVKKAIEANQDFCLIDRDRKGSSKWERYTDDLKDEAEAAKHKILCILKCGSAGTCPFDAAYTDPQDPIHIHYDRLKYFLKLPNTKQPWYILYITRRSHNAKDNAQVTFYIKETLSNQHQLTWTTEAGDKDLFVILPKDAQDPDPSPKKIYQHTNRTEDDRQEDRKDLESEQKNDPEPLANDNKTNTSPTNLVNPAAKKGYGAYILLTAVGALLLYGLTAIMLAKPSSRSNSKKPGKKNS